MRLPNCSQNKQDSTFVPGIRGRGLAASAKSSETARRPPLTEYNTRLHLEYVKLWEGSGTVIIHIWYPSAWARSVSQCFIRSSDMWKHKHQVIHSQHLLTVGNEVNFDTQELRINSFWQFLPMESCNIINLSLWRISSESITYRFQFPVFENQLRQWWKST